MRVLPAKARRSRFEAGSGNRSCLNARKSGPAAKAKTGRTPWTSRWKAVGAERPPGRVPSPCSRGRGPSRRRRSRERLDRLRGCGLWSRTTRRVSRQAISADFGHRSQTETVIAETMMVLSEIRHAAKHLKKWMAPQRVPTALQFMPAKNRLMPQPLGVVGIIAPWNYPLQLTLAPAVGGDRRRQPRHDQAERTGAAVLGAADRTDRAKIRCRRAGRHRRRGRNRQGLRRAAVRSSAVHRLDPRRPRWSRRPPDAI